MARTQVEILIESVANLHLQLSASLARESELREVNADLANRLTHSQFIESAGKHPIDISEFAEAGVRAISEYNKASND